MTRYEPVSQVLSPHDLDRIARAYADGEQAFGWKIAIRQLLNHVAAQNQALVGAAIAAGEPPKPGDVAAPRAALEHVLKQIDRISEDHWWGDDPARGGFDAAQVDLLKAALNPKEDPNGNSPAA